MTRPHATYARWLSQTMLASAIALAALPALAQLVPGAADSSRRRPLEQQQAAPARATTPRVSGKEVVPPVIAPEGSEKAMFALRRVELKGGTVFSDADFADLITPLVGTTISLKRVYELAAQITNRYREKGYLLSYAYVPDQQVSDGSVVIAIAEGYLGNVSVEGDDPNATITASYVERLTQEKPLRERTLESVLLRLNDLPGRSYRAVLSRDKNAPPGESLLTLIPTRKNFQASLNFDNFSSRYLGPNEISASFADSFLPRQQTSLFGLTSIPVDKLNYGAITHSWVAWPDLTLEGSFSYTASQPGYTLTNLNIDSTTQTFSIGAGYQLIRQRNENLSLKLSAESRSVRSDFFNGNPLTRDEIRMLHASASFDINDGWGGTNTANSTLTHGLSDFGASGEGSSHPSRGQASPDFTKFELSLSRLQSLGEDWTVLMQATGQIASNALYASEEFGVGGQAYGRAYDASEIVGDQGAAGMVELRYTGLRTLQPINFEPYAYFDSGFVTNYDLGQPGRESLTSAGGGVRFATIWGQASMVGLAFPLSRPVAAPIYGQSASEPRILAQFSQSF